MARAELARLVESPGSGPSYYFGYSEHRTCVVLHNVDAEDVTGVRALFAVPPWVDASVAADQAPVVPHETVRIA